MSELDSPDKSEMKKSRISKVQTKLHYLAAKHSNIMKYEQ